MHPKSGHKSLSVFSALFDEIAGRCMEKNIIARLAAISSPETCTALDFACKKISDNCDTIPV
jgi:hypothetical protein